MVRRNPAEVADWLRARGKAPRPDVTRARASAPTPRHRLSALPITVSIIAIRQGAATQGAAREPRAMYRTCDAQRSHLKFTHSTHRPRANGRAREVLNGDDT